MLVKEQLHAGGITRSRRSRFGGEREAGSDVLHGEVRKVSEHLFNGHAGCEILQNILHGHSQPPDAWLAAAFVGLDRNQGSVVHDLTVHCRGRPINAQVFLRLGDGVGVRDCTYLPALPRSIVF